MRRSFTAVLERNTTFTSALATEPYEAGWASEARWFVRVLDLASGAVLTVRPRVSPDGLFWCDEGSTPPPMPAPGLYSFALRDFGGWLRLDATLDGSTPSRPDRRPGPLDEPGLDATLDGSAPSARVIIYLALKE